jgi:uncharacterized membrane protein
MSAKLQELRQRFDLLEERVFRLELRLGPETPAIPAAPGSQPQAPTGSPQHSPSAPPPLPHTITPIASEHVVFAEPDAQAERAERMGAPITMGAKVRPRPELQLRYFTPAPQPEEAAAAARGGGTIERAIGLKWAGWVGAVVLMIGAGFGVKFVYDQRWFAQVPAEIWLGLIFAAGLALIGVGEAVYRRIHVVPAASVFGAGVATLFLAGYVGHAYYDLYSPATALFLMAAAALVGALVAMRGNLVSIALLSHLSANIAPLLVGSRSAPLESFLVYLLALQMVSLTLANWGRGRKWWALRGLSLATTALWVAATGLRDGQEQMVLSFSAVYAVLYHGELILATARHARETGSEDHPSSRAANGRPDSAALSLFITAAFTLALLWATSALASPVRGGIILVEAGVFAGLSIALMFRSKNADNGMTALALSHRIAAAGLVILAVPIALHGLAVEGVWGLLALALAVAGMLTQSKIARVSSIVLWLLAVGRLLLLLVLPTELGGHEARAWFMLGSVGISSDAVMACGLSVVGQAVAAMLGRGGGRFSASALPLSVVAGILWVGTAIEALPPLAATAWIVEYAWLLVAIEALAPRLRPSVQAAALILLSALKWLLLDALADRLSGGWSPFAFRPLLNPMMGVSGLLAASMLTLWLIRGQPIWQSLRLREPFPRRSIGVVGFFAALILVIGASFEIDRFFSQSAGGYRAEQVTLSIFWAAAAVASVLIGFRIRAAWLRFFGLGLLAVTLLKVVAIDMSQVQTGYRILSFMGLGVLMLGTSVLYGKFGPRLLREDGAR